MERIIAARKARGRSVSFGPTETAEYSLSGDSSSGGATGGATGGGDEGGRDPLAAAAAPVVVVMKKDEESTSFNPVQTLRDSPHYLLVSLILLAAFVGAVFMCTVGTEDQADWEQVAVGSTTAVILLLVIRAYMTATPTAAPPPPPMASY